MKRKGIKYYLIKSEPESRLENGFEMKYSFDDLKKDGTASWDGVRNYAARKVLREMKVNDLAFFYHSNTKKPAIVGICEITREAYPDETQFEVGNPHFDPKSTEENPRWDQVDVKYLSTFKTTVTREELKENPKVNSTMELFRYGRLSCQRVTPEEWDLICDLGDCSENES